MPCCEVHTLPVFQIGFMFNIDEWIVYNLHYHELLILIVLHKNKLRIDWCSLNLIIWIICLLLHHLHSITHYIWFQIVFMLIDQWIVYNLHYHELWMLIFFHKIKLRIDWCSINLIIWIICLLVYHLYCILHLYMHLGHLILYTHCYIVVLLKQNLCSFN